MSARRAGWLAVLLALAPVAAAAQVSAPEPAPLEAAPNDAAGYTPPAEQQSPLTVTGYVDLGYAHATGNGSSFDPADTRVPADYGEDPFAPAVNSRGDVASTDSNGHFTNHFLPYSVGIGSTPSFLINTVSADARYAPTQVPVLLFTRVQVMPRFNASGEDTQVPYPTR